MGLENVKPGDSISAAAWNELRRRAEGGVGGDRTVVVGSVGAARRRHTSSLVSTGQRRRARVTSVSQDNDHYVGKLVDAYGEDLNEEDPVDLYCWKYPTYSHDIFDYVPSVDVATGESHVPVEEWTIVIDDGEPQTIWIIVFPFCYTCRADLARSRGIRPERPRPVPPKPRDPSPPDEQEGPFFP